MPSRLFLSKRTRVKQGLRGDCAFVQSWSSIEKVHGPHRVIFRPAGNSRREPLRHKRESCLQRSDHLSEHLHGHRTIPAHHRADSDPIRGKDSKDTSFAVLGADSRSSTHLPSPDSVFGNSDFRHRAWVETDGPMTRYPVNNVSKSHRNQDDRDYNCQPKLS